MGWQIVQINTTAESTQINITDSASMADHWHLFTTIDRQSGEQHHVAHLSIYILAVIILVIIVLSIALALC